MSAGSSSATQTHGNWRLFVGPLDIAILSAVVAVFALCAGTFASQQTIWLDETTQLTGLTLSFGEQLAWLSGHSDKVLGVPPDRAPPLSYWIGSLWAEIFGLSETSLRWMGIVAVCLAAPAIYFSGRAVGGRTGGILALGLVFFSGNIIVGSVEIRAYPLFFAASAWAIYYFVELIVSDDRERGPRRLAMLCVFLLLSIYSHFFGVVAAACLLAALLLHEWLVGRSVGRVLVAGAAVAILSFGITPFVLAAINVSGGAAQSNVASLAESLAGLIRLIFRLTAHPSYFATPMTFAVFLAALASLAAIGALRVLSAARETTAVQCNPLGLWQAVAIALPLVFAVCGLTILARAVKSFDVLAPHYNLWLVPLPAILLALAFRDLDTSSPPVRLATRTAGAIAIACNLIAASTLLQNASLFSHGPGEWAADAIDDPATTLVIHDGKGAWGFLYFPLYFLTDGAVTQWVGNSGATMQRVSTEGLLPITDPTAEAAKFRTIIQAQSRSLTSMEIADIARGNTRCTFETPRVLDLVKDGGGRTTSPPESRHFCAVVSTSLSIWEK